VVVQRVSAVRTVNGWTRCSATMASDGHCGVPAPKTDAVPSGETGTWDGIPVYYKDAEGAKAAVMLATDLFGYEVPQVRKIADYFASLGFLAVVPDLTEGQPFNPDTDTFQSWLPKHPAEKQGPTLLKIADYVSTKYGIHSFGIMGFCWGCKAVTAAAADAKINAGVLAHPSFVTEEEVLAVKNAICILGAEIDQISPPELIAKFETALKASPEKAGKFKVKHFPKVAHGWTVRYDTSKEEAVKAATEAHMDAASFFKEHL